MKKLLDINEVIKKIENGDRLLVAGDENLLKKLPRGNWIGGTIPYFMAENGGVFTKDLIFVDEIPLFSKDISIKYYEESSLPNIVSDEFENGYSIIIIPAFSDIHTLFAKESKNFKNIFLRPLVGWISGVDLADLGKIKPKVFNGFTGEISENKAVVMHIELPENKFPIVDIINIFTQGTGDIITFDINGFEVSECFINGEREILSDYIAKMNVDTKLPLVADYYGAMVNTCFSNIDNANKKVSFYAPVFKDIEYKIASPVNNYIDSFDTMISGLSIDPVFTCNCILNYLYSELEGKKTSSFTGPITFGEIAYQLLNQTLVYLEIHDV
jgi:hypothetical protein